ncbi:hypothetical protein OPT61_g9154 [Boeremia exigua]|uniref:Uncharacterized protein n=1 Tax=Boeremia exigua TaxID=749465 RepID=A0ACC2HVJ6_9PLEO|nr:hypothetical protein OPT61_g9154 [Boeremia exigua]
MDQLTSEEVASLRAENRGPQCEQIVIAFTTLAFVSLVAIGTCVCQVLQVKAGNGKHAIFVKYPEDTSEILKVCQPASAYGLYINSGKWLFFSIITYNISLTVTKISILLQYHRIFTLREMRIPVYGALIIVSVWGTITVFTAIFTCVPVAAYWRVTEQASAKCVNQPALWYTNASVNIFTDLMVAVIPVRGIWSLQIPKRQKLALLGILTIGWHQHDSTYFSAPAAYWSSIEANLAIVCASLPALKPLVVRVIPVFGSRHSSRGHGSNAASANNHRLQKLGSKIIWRSADDKEKLTSVSSVSHAHSVASRPSESEQHGRNIYVTKHFEQHIENAKTHSSSDQEVTAAEFLGHDTGR